MGKRVLVAEDEPNIATSLTFLLERAGYKVSVVTDGNAALDTVLADTPDALVLDLMLPGIDGYEVLRRVRSEPACADLPVMVLSAKGQAEDRQIALDLGANIYVTKPFSNAELLETVETLTGGA